MDLNKLYKEIEEAEVDLNAKRLGDYIQLYTTTKKQSLTSTSYNLITIFIKMLLWGCLHFQISISLPSRIRVKT